MFCSGYRRGCRRRRGWRRYRCSGRCGRKLRLGFVVILRKRIIRKRWRLMRRCRHDRRQWRRWLRCRYGRLWRRCWYRRLWLGWLRFRLRRGLFCSYSNNFIYSSSCFCCCVRYIAQLTRSSIDCMCFLTTVTPSLPGVITLVFPFSRVGSFTRVVLYFSTVFVSLIFPISTIPS